MAELEARGIGRPSTYASVIQTIQDRGYVWKKGTALVPSWTAFAVVRLLEEYFTHLVDYDFTARMEEALDDIARGERESVPWLRQFYFGNGVVGLRTLVEKRVPEIDAREINTIPIGADAEGREIVVRVGRYGPYLSRGGDGARPRRDRPRRAHPGARLRAARAGPGEAGPRHRPGHRPRDQRAGRPLRPLRAARRAGGGLEEEAEAGQPVQDHDARHGHARRGAAAAQPAPGGRYRRRGQGDRRQPRALRAVHQEGRRTPAASPPRSSS